MAKKVRGSAADIADRQVKRASAAVGDWQEGIDRVTEHPGKLAAKQKDKMVANLVAKVQDGTWERNVGAGTLEGWKARTKKKGGTRYPGGVQEAKDRVEAFFDQFIPHLEAGMAEVHEMADLTIEDSRARMNAMFDHNVKFSYDKSKAKS